MLDLLLFAAVALACAPILRRLLSKYTKGGVGVVNEAPTDSKHNEKENAPAGAFIASPEPFSALTPESLSSHDARDHLFANKTIRHPYFQTMAHQPMSSEHWIEPDHHYLSDLQYKKELVEKQGKVVCDALPCVVEACGEMLGLLSSWLVKRYPGMFKWEEGGEGRSLRNLATDTKLSLIDEITLQRKVGIPALKVVSQLVQDDFLIAFPSEANDGSWITAGGLVCFPGFYLLSDKIGLSLHDTHTPVPQFNEKLLKSVERSLTRLLPSSPIERTSWEIVEPEDDLFWAPMAGPLPTKAGRNGACPKPMRECHTAGRSEDACSSEDPSKLLLRLDHQTFVKMPKSGAVFFGVHPMRRPLSSLADTPLLPALLLNIHRDGPKDLMVYKGAPSYEKSVLPYLETLNRIQIETGLIKEEEVEQAGKLFRERKR